MEMKIPFLLHVSMTDSFDMYVLLLFYDLIHQLAEKVAHKQQQGNAKQKVE